MNPINKTVLTVCGKTVSKKEARLIAGRYYLPGESCFKFTVNGKNKYYRIESAFIAYDYSKGTFELRKELKYYGVVGINKDNTPIFGRFSIYLGGPKVFTTEDGHTFKEYPALSYDILNKKWPEDLSSGMFYDPSNRNVDYQKLKSKKKLNYGNQFIIDYNANSKNTSFIAINEAYSKNQIPFTKEVEKIASYFKKYTFGIEFETIKGTIPAYLLGKLGILPLRDGSISGYEYTTIPLNGVKGIQTITNICEELTKRCEYDHTCSMHVHIGNVRTDMLYLTVLYNLLRSLQAELFSIVPKYKTDPITLAGLRKNYCQKLNDINMVFPETLFQLPSSQYEAVVKNNYQMLYNFCSGGIHANIIENPVVHPQGDQKWNRTNRYFFVNFIPMIYDNKTIEFRLHSGTFNVDKVLFWMLLNIAILEYADTLSKEIHLMKTITLNAVIEKFASQFENSNIGDKLKEYVFYRKELFNECAKNNDVMGKADIHLDKTGLPVSLFSNKDQLDIILSKSFMYNNKLCKYKDSPLWAKRLMGDGDGIPLQQIFEDTKTKLV